MSSQRMSNGDAAWLHMGRSTNLMVVNGLMWFDEPLDVQRVRDIVRERLVDRFPRFRQRVAEPPLGLGAPSWQTDPGFDLDLHIHQRTLPAPGDDAALQALVADLVVVPLDPTKPLWHMYIIDGYGSGTAVLTRIHHCIADGIALTQVLLSLTDADPGAGVAATSARTGRGEQFLAPARDAVHLADAALHQSFELAIHPRSETFGLAGRVARGTRALAKLLLSSADAKSVFTGQLGVARKLVWTDRIELDEIKAIGHATGTTVNDVILAAISGALHRYMTARGDRVDEIRAMVPFNLRPLDEPLPRELGNRFGLVYLPLPVGVAAPAARLREVHRRMDAIKHSPEGALSYALLGIIGATPLPVERRLVDVLAPKTSAVMTNVPGPREPIHFAGSQVTGILAWVPASGSIGMGISIFSYDGGVRIGLQVDAGLVPDPETIIAAIGDELTELVPASPRPRRRRKPVAATATATTTARG